MRGLGIIILIVLFFWLVWPSISRWLKRKAMERAEDYVRSSMGMPPRDKKKRKKEGGFGGYRSGYDQRERRNPFGADRYTDEPLIPKEYAEDVEFTETKDYSSSETHTTPSGVKKETYNESQISDAEWTEVKKPRTK